jgi:hypothetical protein
MTAQIHEALILDGKKTSLACCPPIPKGHPRIGVPSRNEPISEEDRSWRGSTACWRDYIGFWEIKDGRFYLIGLRGCMVLRGSDPLFADWFTGALRVPQGKMLKYIHMDFGSIYEQELHIKIEKGLVVETHTVDKNTTTRCDCEFYSG